MKLVTTITAEHADEEVIYELRNAIEYFISMYDAGPGLDEDFEYYNWIHELT